MLSNNVQCLTVDDNFPRFCFSNHTAGGGGPVPGVVAGGIEPGGGTLGYPAVS